MQIAPDSHRPRSQILTQYGQPAARPENLSGARKAQPWKFPQEPDLALRARLDFSSCGITPRNSPKTRSRVPAPKYWVSVFTPLESRTKTPGYPVPTYLAPSAGCLGRSIGCFGNTAEGHSTKTDPDP